MKSQDLEYHHIDPARSLGLALARTPAAWEIPEKEITHGTSHPPTNTRAAVRSQAMHLLKEEAGPYFIDWEIIGAEGGNSLHLLNPFESSSQEAENWIQMLAGNNGKTARRAKVSSGS
jgi:hypothetical protein